MVDDWDWLTVKEACELSGYHADHIRELLRDGRIDGRKWGTAWMVSKESLLQYKAEAQGSGKKRGPKKRA